MSSYHGGQDNNVKIDFIEDFSVTTNMIGPNKSGLEEIKTSLNNINHYPPQNFEPYKSNLKEFIFKNNKSSNLLLGNGASELIELLIGNISKNLSTYHIVNSTQYMEYKNSCLKHKLTETNLLEADIVCLVNPNNPTGKFYTISEIKTNIINKMKPSSHLILDESMIFWKGNNWRDYSMSSQIEYLENLTNINVYIVMSWTKIFSCTGLRYGSLIIPNLNIYQYNLYRQVPWTVNILALKYIDFCIKDEQYLKKTWEQTKISRKYAVNLLKKIFPVGKFMVKMINLGFG